MRAGRLSDTDSDQSSEAVRWPSPSVAPAALPLAPVPGAGTVPGLAHFKRPLSSVRFRWCLQGLRLAAFRNGHGVGQDCQVLHPGGDPETQPQQEYLVDPAP